MMTLIAILLLLNVVASGFQLYRDALIYTRNTANFVAQIAELKELNESYSKSILRMAGERFDEQGLILTPDGIKALPKNWREKLFPENVSFSIHATDEDGDHA